MPEASPETPNNPRSGDTPVAPGRPEDRSAAASARSVGLSARLHALLAEPPAAGFTIRDLFRSLAGRGHAALLIVLSLPFCLPVPLFGLSTVFGAMLAFIGLRIAFGHRPWLPAWVLSKPVRAETVARMAEKTEHLERRMRGVLRPRYTEFCRHRLWHILHGLTIALMATLLALPLPVPFSNTTAALPILILGAGLLEDDGVFVAIGYAAALVGSAAFLVLFWYSGVGIGKLFGIEGGG